MTQNSAQIFCVGLNHKTADLKLRERFYYTSEAFQSLIPKLKEIFCFDELFGLSTCNRTEFYGAGSIVNPETFAAELFRHIECSSVIQEALSDGMVDHCYVYWNKDAIHHVFEVASSLDSLVIGETQITGQFKDAFQLAQSQSWIGPMWQRVGQEALAIAKRVRNETDLGSESVSIGRTAVRFILQMYPDIKERRVVVLGAGDMAQSVLAYLAKEEPLEVTILNRTYERAAQLAKEFDAKVGAWQDFSEVITQADVLITAVASVKPVVSKATILNAMQSRDQKELLIMDIGLPRNVESSVNNLEDVFLFCVDDLKKIVDENLAKRQAARVKAEDILHESVQRTVAWIENLATQSLLASLHRYLWALASQELEKTLSRQNLQTLDPSQKASLEAGLRSIVEKIQGDFSRTVKSADIDSEQVARFVEKMILPKG